MNYQETLDYLYAQLPMFQKQGGAAYKKDLQRTLALCAHLGDPQHQFRSIHFAGTNGKGSCSHLLASVLQTAGYKTGLYTSPHLKDFRERIRINGAMIDQEEVIAFVEEHKQLFADIQPSFFEWTVALAFHYFAKEKVDVAVIETGLGGRLDSTNVILPELSVITNISFDHMAYLGNTLEAIAGEKAGIIKAGVPVVIGEAGRLRTFFSEKAKEKSAPIRFAEDRTVPTYPTDLKGSYQRKNVSTVVAAVEKLNALDFRISEEELRKGLVNVVANTQLKGRWQVLQEQPLMVADTAHNEGGIQEIVQQIQQTAFSKLHIVWGMVKDKAVDDILSMLPKVANYYFCKPNLPRGLDAKQLLETAKPHALNGAVYPSVEAAIAAAKQAAENADMIYIGGSTFVVAEAI